MKRFNKTLLTAVLVAVTSVTAVQQASAYVPVIDPTAIAKQIEEIYQLRQQVQAVVDNGNYASLISNPTVRNQLNRYLPAKYNDVLEAMRAGDTKALQVIMQKAMQEEARAKTTQSAQARALAAEMAYSVQNKINVDRLTTRSNQIQTMVNQLNRTANIAQKQDLTATIQAQSAIMQNEIAMVQLGMQRLKHEQERANALLGSQAYIKQRATTAKTLNTMFGTGK